MNSILSSALATHASQNGHKSLVVGSEQNFPPFATGMTDSTAGGFTVDFWKEVAKEAGLKYTLRVLPFRQVLQEFKEGRIDVLINLAISDERHQFSEFSVPHVIVNGAIFVHDDNTTIKSEDDLLDQSIIVLNADLAHNYAISKGWTKQLILVDTVEIGLKLLSSGKHDAMLLSKLVGMQLIQELGLDNLKPVNTPAGFSQKFAFAVSKGNAELLSQINEAMAVTNTNGIYTSLYDKWFGVFEEKKLTQQELTIYITSFILLILALFASFYYYRYVEQKKDLLRKESHQHVLELIVNGESLSEILDAIVRDIERENPSMLCSILLLDDTGKHLLNGASPSLPDFFNEAIHGTKIGLNANSCGIAANTGERLIVNDIENHPLLKTCKKLITKAGLSAYWSEPILSTQSELLGTFAIYHKKIIQPTESNILLIEQAAKLASIAIEKIQTKLILSTSEERWKFALEGSGDGVWDWDIPINKVWVSKQFKSMLGYAEDEFDLGSGQKSSHIHPEDVLHVLSQLQQHLDGQLETYMQEYRMRCKDGSYKWVLSRGLITKRDAANNPIRIVGTHTDITERKQFIEKLQLAASVFSNAREGILITDSSGTIIEVNETVSFISGYSREELIGQNPRIFQSGRQSPSLYEEMWKALVEKGNWYGEVWNRDKKGTLYAEHLTISAVKDTDGKTQNYVALFNDITLKKQHQAQLEHIVHFDILTNLPNRVLLADRLSQAIIQCQRKQNALAVVFLDLDKFKEVNDTYGHDIGDELLILVSKKMKDALREGDTLARIGGDEFVAILPDLDNTDDCYPLLERLLMAASEPMTIDNIILEVSASIGVTIYPQDNEGADILMRHADQAMYKAKQLGKNCYHIFDTAIDDALKGQQQKLEAIRSALDNHQFVLYYQPKVNLKTGIVIGFEALIRWQHPERGLLNPIEFLPVIENNIMSIEVGEWVIETALKQISQWQVMGLNLPLSISVNISAIQIQQSTFVDTLRTLLAAHSNVEPHCLQLEILETSALSDVQHVSAIMNSCIALGVNFALDDFGTGYSSLTHLRRLPANLIKIDQTFIRDMLYDDDDFAIVEGVIGLARSFKLDVIAEGVETIEHSTALLALGCELAQGYAIAKPMPASEIPAWVNGWKPM